MFVYKLCKWIAVFIFIIFFLFETKAQNIVNDNNKKVVTGSERLDIYLPLIKNKRVALVVNQTSTIGNKHIIDSLLTLGVDVNKVFAPEHGFRGDIGAGVSVNKCFDKKTRIPIVSIYGKDKKPSKSMLKDVDVVIFDIQDVGARFYTYISTLHYVMEACAENGVPLIVLDRPNPNDFVDGPMLDVRFRSFVGMDKIPLLHGCTVGELANMINGNHWLKNGISCNLTVVKVKNWKHGQFYHVPVKPSPNLPNDLAIRLYPSLCLFEGTEVSVGRGTLFPFQVVGYPDSIFGKFTFTPKPIKGVEMNPLQNGNLCYGLDLRDDNNTKGFNLKYLLMFYHISGLGKKFFSKAHFFDKLAGTDMLRKQIIQGVSENDIRKSWNSDLCKYNSMRKKYLLY